MALGLAPTKTAVRHLPPGMLTNGAGPSLGAPLGSMTNTGQPLAPPQIQAPVPTPSPHTAPFQFSPVSLGGDGSAGSAMSAPTATPYGAFQAPGPGMSAYGKYRLAKGQQAIERGAAARGTLLTGGLQNRLQEEAQGIASEEAQNDYDRALSTYNTNRDTARGNFGESVTAFQAGTGAALDAGRLNLAGTTAAYDRNYGAGRDTFNDTREAAGTQANVINTNNQASAVFQQQMADYRAALEAQQRQAVMEQDAATTRMRGTPPMRAPLPGSPALKRMSLGG